jgi:hypothetical protein
MKTEEPDKPAANIAQEGEKVTGGAEAATHNAGAESDGDEAAPTQDSKKEDIAGYNELPDQAKVGGG